jgi:hypothetical protein
MLEPMTRSPCAQIRGTRAKAWTSGVLIRFDPGESIAGRLRNLHQCRFAELIATARATVRALEGNNR